MANPERQGHQSITPPSFSSSPCQLHNESVRSLSLPVSEQPPGKRDTRMRLSPYTTEGAGLETMSFTHTQTHTLLKEHPFHTTFHPTGNSHRRADRNASLQTYVTGRGCVRGCTGYLDSPGENNQIHWRQPQMTDIPLIWRREMCVLPAAVVRSSKQCIGKVYMAERMLMWSVGKSIGAISNIHLFYEYTCNDVSSKNAASSRYIYIYIYILYIYIHIYIYIYILYIYILYIYHIYIYYIIYIYLYIYIGNKGNK